MLKRQLQPLLGRRDPAPVELVNPDSTSPVVFVCEHAGNALPERLGNLGLPEGALNTHIAFDIGAEQVARGLAEKFGAPLVLQRYSRLVVDCNRPPGSFDSMIAVSDGTEVPGNVQLAPHERQARVDEIFLPFDRAVKRLLEHPARKAAFAIHSFNPTLLGKFRPWEVGFLFRHDEKTARGLRRFLSSAAPVLGVGMNQPYAIDDASDWFVPRHAERLKLAHALIEIRNDQLGTKTQRDYWIDLLETAIHETMNGDRT
ncbi:MAG: N-formylglutamate amidohydrolase [Alphaproteobacteria bacterium]|nr:N-formylglutamate amidohydrolase [Alphaproteobacteria bacterium]